MVKHPENVIDSFSQQIYSRRLPRLTRIFPPHRPRIVMAICPKQTTPHNPSLQGFGGLGLVSNTRTSDEAVLLPGRGSSSNATTSAVLVSRPAV